MLQSPNILFISVDDLNDWVGVLGGYPGVKTPNIDALAGRGTLFSNAYTPVPVCNGCRTAVLTGLSPSTTGVFSNNQDWRDLLPNVEALPEYFKNQGYETIGAGKVFHKNKLSAFDQYFGSQNEEEDSENPNSPIKYKALDIPIEEMPDAQVASFVETYLQQNHEQPFFLAVGFSKPHEPLAVPKEFFELYPLETVELPHVPENDLNDVPRLGKNLANQTMYSAVLESGTWGEIVQAYLASISFADAMVGQVLDALDGSNYKDNTIVVFWSDNGWHLGEKLHWGKNTLWDEATHVPLIISAPAGWFQSLFFSRKDEHNNGYLYSLSWHLITFSDTKRLKNLCVLCVSVV